ncbi:uncharacterized protein LOC114851789 isoform X2 [Betta splendens]|uniref:Uncharacterized protein LOC114851789 isoform X2 n=1 Tax=Betta splendens TaxID=158456 RepID=A0A6P7LX21_BETSP|nr:uncharacterized protein LOC114851789 isoform X2 [Betta splendens]
MVQLQLCSLEHLMSSGYGRPYPRHGLQLLFWFANNCVTFEQVGLVLIIRLVSDCQPEKGSYGFHWFGNAEQLLPVMSRPRRSNSKKQTMYFEVGNLNTETYPGSADLPKYVRSRLVEAVYITEHDGSGSGRFSFEKTYQISTALIQALQSTLLDITTFLTQMGYYAQTGECQSYNTVDVIYPDLSGHQTLQPYTLYTAGTNQNYDLAFFSETFQQQASGYNQHTHYITQDNSQQLAAFREMQAQFRTARYSLHGWYKPCEGFDEKAKKGKGGGGFSWVQLLLGAGALYLAVQCFRWLRSWCEHGFNQNVLKRTSWTSPCFKQTHVMLDYVY